MYTAKKHWWFWIPYIFLSILFCWTIIIPIWLIIWAVLRWKLDKLEIKDGCLYSRTGILNIDKKSIPLEKISIINIKSDIISEALNFGQIEVQSSAFGKSIYYPCIENPQGLVDFFNSAK